MQDQITQLEKLIERKKAYFLRAEKQNIRDVVQVEINILQNTVLAMQQSIEAEFLNEIASSEKETKMYEAVKSLEAICLMHGIDDYPMYYKKGLNILIGTLKELVKKEEVIIPNQLKFIYG